MLRSTQCPLRHLMARMCCRINSRVTLYLTVSVCSTLSSMADSINLASTFPTERRRGPVVGHSLWTRPARVQSPWEARIIRCKNLALYIRDCESLCLSDETVKAVGPFYLVSMPGEVKDPTQGLSWIPHSNLEKDNSLKTTPVLAQNWAVWGTN